MKQALLLVGFYEELNLRDLSILNSVTCLGVAKSDFSMKSSDSSLPAKGPCSTSSPRHYSQARQALGSLKCVNTAFFPTLLSLSRWLFAHQSGLCYIVYYTSSSVSIFCLCSLFSYKQESDTSFNRIFLLSIF